LVLMKTQYYLNPILLVACSRACTIISFTLNDHTSSMSKSCFLSDRDLRRTRNAIDHSNPQTNLSFISKLTNFWHVSLFAFVNEIIQKLTTTALIVHNISRSNLDHPRLILHSAARCVDLVAYSIASTTSHPFLSLVKNWSTHPV